MLTVEYMERLTRQAVNCSNLSDDQVKAIASYAVEHDCGVWHATAQVIRDGKNCNCAKCCPVIRRTGKSPFRYHSL